MFSTFKPGLADTRRMLSEIMPCIMLTVMSTDVSENSPVSTPFESVVSLIHYMRL